MPRAKWWRRDFTLDLSRVLWTNDGITSLGRHGALHGPEQKPSQRVGDTHHRQRDPADQKLVLQHVRNDFPAVTNRQDAPREIEQGSGHQQGQGKVYGWD